MNRVRSFLWMWALLLAATSIAAAQRNEPAGGTEQVTVETLKAIEAQTEQLVAKALPCTVCVRDADGGGSGSGVVVSQDGLVLTAAHVMMAAGRNLMIVFPDGREVPAKPLGANRNRDAGMVQILTEGSYPYVELGASADLQTNQWCVAMGHAGGFDPRRTPPVRLGRVLGNERFLTTDSALISGDSGGPLFDLQGRLIGIHSNIGESLSMNNHVPVDVYRTYWDRLRRGDTWGRLPGTGGDPDRPVLGIQFSENPADGTRIVGVSPGSPAEKAGVQAGDVVQAVDGQPVEAAQDVIARVSRLQVGDRVTLRLQRADRSLELSAKLTRIGDLPEDPSERDEDQAEADQAEERNTPKAAQRPPSKGNDKADDGAPSDEAEDTLDFDRLMRRARENGGRLRLSPEQFQQLQRQMAERLAATEPGYSDEAVQWGRRVFAAYAPVVAPVRHSVLPVVVRGRQVALATAVAEDRLITKASELGRGEFQVRQPDGELASGELVKVFREHDLALIRLPDARLKPVQWAASQPLKLGQFVAVASDQEQPEAIGVVSVMPRNLDAALQGFLGVVPEPHRDGVRLMEIDTGTPAATAGLQVGDLVLQLEGRTYTSPAAFARAISEHSPGEKITLRIRRGDVERTLSVELGDRTSVTPMPGQMGAMNQLGGPLSRRRDRFPEVVQHDSPLDPEDCGGPLVNLSGQAIAINIARAGRIKSYAIPAPTVQQLLRQQ